MSLGAIIGEAITVSVGGRGYALRPTLGAAIGVLEAGPGYEGALERLRAGEFGFALAVFAHGIDDGVKPPSDADCWDAFGGDGLLPDLMRFVMILANGGEPLKPVEADEKRAAGGKALSHEDYAARLFKLGTGWLGWTAAETLATPMPAIVSAYLGRVDMFSTLFGDGGAEASSRNSVPLETKIRAAMQGARKVERPKRPGADTEGQRAAGPTT